MHVTVPYCLLSLDSKVAGLLVGRNMSNPYVKSHFFGIICGSKFQNGRPRSGAVADCMRRSRAAYHYAVRSIKKDEYDEYNIRCERIMNSAAMNDDRSFWAEIKKN